MKKIGLFKKLSLYLFYRKTILKNKDLLLSSSNLKIDNINRIYTVLNIPTDVFDSPYDLRTADINKISEPYVQEAVKQISAKLNSIGISELYELYNISKIDKFSYLIIIGFKFFNTNIIARKLLFRYLPIISIIALSLLIGHHFKLFNF